VVLEKLELRLTFSAIHYDFKTLVHTARKKRDRQ
jgi:hypothetical protein